MPNTIGNNKASQEHRSKIETVRFNLIFARNNLELIAKHLEHGLKWLDFKPTWLTRADELLKETIAFIDELLNELKG